MRMIVRARVRVRVRVRDKVVWRPQSASLIT